MNDFKKILKNESGVALMMIMTAIILLMAIYGEFTFESKISRIKATNVMDRSQAKLLAGLGAVRHADDGDILVEPGNFDLAAQRRRGDRDRRDGEQRGLAGPRRADDRSHAGGIDVQVDVQQNRLTSAVFLAQMLDRKQGRCLCVHAQGFFCAASLAAAASASRLASAS